MAVLTREAILGAQDLKRERVMVKEWGGEVIVTELTAARRLEMERAMPEDEGRIWLVLAVFCCVDEAGMPLFTEQDVQELEQKNAKVLIRIGKVALRLNRVGGREADALDENFPVSQG